ncbi:MAG: ribonuclease P protein component [Verrucomicrobiota bacterium]
MRMRSRQEFSRVRTEGRSFPGKYFVLGVLADADLGDGIRFGVILTRKVGKAHDRNRVRRRIKGLLSDFGEQISPGHWLVFVGRRPSVDCSFAQLRHDWVRLGRKAGILNPDKNAPSANPSS